MGKSWKAIVCMMILMAVPVLCRASGLDSVKKTYAGINTLDAKFHQKLFIENIKKTREFDGEFSCKRGKGFLWRYTSPKTKYFLFDGQYMWQGDEEKTFVLKEKINKEKTGGTFFDLVEDITKIDDLFTLKRESITGALTVLDLVPKKEGNVTSAKVWIDEHDLVRKIEIREFTGNINTIEFSSIAVNPSIGDEKFVFKPDKKKEIVEQ